MLGKYCLRITAIFATVLFCLTAAAAQQRFVAHLNTIQEVPPTNASSSARGKCDIILNAAETQISVSCNYTGLTTPLTLGHIHGTAPPGVNAGVLFNFNPPTGSTSGSFNAGPYNLTPAQVAQMRQKLFYVNLHTSMFPGGEIRGQIKITTTVSDFEGDGRSDVTVFRQSDNTFYSLLSINNTIFAPRWGSGGGDIRLADTTDFDGDGRSDAVVTENVGNDLYWSILQTGTNSVRVVKWGFSAASDLRVPADYDGDGRQDIAVFRRTTGVWHIILSANDAQVTENFGAANDFGVVGDYDKDGRSDLTVLRGTTSGVGWFTRLSSNNTLQIAFFGGADIPAGDFIFPSAVVDFDGDGRQDRFVVRDPNTSTTNDPMTYYILRSSDNQVFTLQWGLDSDGRFFGDYDGDGRTDLVVRRNINNQLVWFIYQTSNGQARVVPFGITGDQFVGEVKDEAYSVAVK